MANVIQIKSGHTAPPNGALKDAELGFDKINEDLYVGNKGKVVRVSCKIDNSLTKAGQAADAQATGEAIRTHTTNKNNPHKVTAQQLGAVTQEEMKTFPKNGSITMEKLANDVKQALSPLAHMPIGYIYMSLSNTSPAELFGGSWEKIEGRFLLGSGQTGDGKQHNAGSTGGEAMHKLTTAEMPWHSHYITPNGNAGWYAGTTSGLGTPQKTDYGLKLSYELAYGETLSRLVGTAVGDSKYHNNMPPYLAVNIWKRVS